MATHRIVLLISDEEITGLDDSITTLDNLCDNYTDDWNADEEPLVSLNAQETILLSIRDKIKREVLAQ